MVEFTGSDLITPKLIELLRQEHRLEWDGIHGFQHWVRVRTNGLRLAEQHGADPKLVELFAFFHDIRRENDHRDPGHGARAAKFIDELPRKFLPVSEEGLELLKYACRFHTSGLVEADLTVQTCWDADRLDLGRAGITPNPKYLCTEAAKDPAMIAWAYRRSLEVE